MNELPKLYNDNLIRINPFFPDSKHTALRDGLYNYYETYRIFSGSGFYTYFHKGYSEAVLSEAKSHDYITKYFASVTFIHLYFEQLIIEILDSINPILAKGRLNKELDLVNVISNQYSSIDFKNKNNVDYYIALQRLEVLINNDNTIPNEFKVPPQYHFLIDHLETLRILAKLRNDIIHSGQHILNRFFYELLFVNRLLPLICKLLRLDKPVPFLERNLACGINILNKIIEEPLIEDYRDLSKYDDLTKNLNRINHLKELGRASYNNPIHMLEDVVSEEHKQSIEESFNKRKKEEAKLQVLFKQYYLGHYEIYSCPCCGVNSLTTFDYWTVIANQKTRVEKAECAVCGYTIHIELGEPKNFGFLTDEIFKYVD
jgi:hypothetical protein